jgi:hypothetical protein
MLISIVAGQAGVFPAFTQSPASPPPSATLVGRWRVKFTQAGDVEKNLIFDSKAQGSGSFQLLDTGPDNKSVVATLPAVWSQLTDDRVSFSGEVELPLGTCCREIGTLIFKGKFNSINSISGKLIFVTSIDEAENPYQFRSMVGTFTATRIVSGSRSGRARPVTSRTRSPGLTVQLCLAKLRTIESTHLRRAPDG